MLWGLCASQLHGETGSLQGRDPTRLGTQGWALLRESSP